jgi:hypothetical protein
MNDLNAPVYLIPSRGSSSNEGGSILSRYDRSSIGPLRGASSSRGNGNRFKATSRTVSAIDQTSEFILQSYVVRVVLGPGRRV